MERGGYNRGNVRGGGGGGGRGGGRGGRGGGSGGGWGSGDQRPTYNQQRQHHDYQSGGRGGGGRGPSYGGGNPPPQQWGSRPYRPPLPQAGEGFYSGESSGGGGGRGRGAWSSSGGGARRPPQTQRHSEPFPDMQMARMSVPLPKPSLSKTAETNLLPVRRPDEGGKITIQSPKLLVNHFLVDYNPNFTIIHYDIDIKQELSPKARPSKMQKSYHRMIKDKLFSDNPSEFPLSQTVYDGEKNIFSVVQLPTGNFTISFSVAEDMRTNSYSVAITEVNRLKLSKLKDYIERKVLVTPRDVLQGMDLVMKENPSRCRITVGRSFYPTEHTKEDHLIGGIIASKGFQQSLKPTSQGLALCLDYSVLAFRKRWPVIDFLLEHITGAVDLSALRHLGRREMVEVLKGLKVTVTHRVTKQKYIIMDLTEKSTRNTDFDVEDPEGGSRRVGVVEYYRQKYGKEIVHKDIPCLDLGKNNRKNYVPMEFCVLVEGQRYPKEQLDWDGGKYLKDLSLAKPDVRRRTICGMVKADDGPCGGGISQNFGLQVVKDMTNVEARVIDPPPLKVGATNHALTVDREKRQWNLVGKVVVEGKALQRWALIDFSSTERSAKFRLNCDSFVHDLRNRCQSLGICMEAPLVHRSTSMGPFSNIDSLQKLLESVVREANEKRKGKLQMILCVMSCQHPGYKSLKWLSETKIGTVTQCCLSERANDGCRRDQFFANLGIKINAKLGGSNVELSQGFPNFPGEGPAMFIGADVNHPGARNSNTPGARDYTSPSIAAVVGTVNWPAANRYAARVCPQNHRTEKIMNFGSMCKELIEAYARINKVKPQRIVVFRDGVSEGQFNMVLNEELFDLKEAIYDDHYRPTITLVVAQKRHQTRLFPLRQVDGGATGNVPPGTVVDTVITHPFEFDFYLCSHYGGLGTSKPTHYYVLYDDHNFTSDLLQKLIYDLCFTFARCTKPVSLVPPVYYADLVAYRGRMFEEVLAFASPKLDSSSLSSASASSAASLDDQPYKLHPELEDVMFFV